MQSVVKNQHVLLKTCKDATFLYSFYDKAFINLLQSFYN